MRYVIVGTAGHVDHGKTALVRALTGIDTDRLAEEKRRGISIDLGFAAYQVSDAVLAGIVDVPGHERFLKNMLAGTGGIDIAVLVVAADEGIMPQTREHLAMLELYGIREGIVVLTKMDKIEQEWAELVKEEVQEAVKGTFLTSAPICCLSARTGDGLEELKILLQRAVERVRPRDVRSPFRMWVDRSFSVKGHGTVLTGTVLSGSIGIDEELMALPLESSARVRGLESHGRRCERLEAGQRGAINVTGLETQEVSRGMMLTENVRGLSSCHWDVQSQVGELPNGTRIRLHVGTGEWIGRFLRFKGGDAAFGRLLLEKPLAAAPGDRGILRLYSPMRLLGGVRLLLPTKAARRMGIARQELAAALEAESPEDAVLAVLLDADGPYTLEEIERRMPYWPQSVVRDAVKQLQQQQAIVTSGAQVLARACFERLQQRAMGLIQAFHAERPDRPGLGKETLRQRLALGERAFHELLEAWGNEGQLIVDGAEVALLAHRKAHVNRSREWGDKADHVLSPDLVLDITTEYLVEALGVPAGQGKAVQDALVRQGILCKLADMHIYTKALQKVRQQVRQWFNQQATLSVAEFRDLAQTSRKYAVPLLEFFDQKKWTIRDGANRRAGININNLSE